MRWVTPQRDMTLLRRGESYAERFRKIWEFGLRGSNNCKPDQILTQNEIYEVVVMNPFQYSRALRHYRSMRDNHFKRNPEQRPKD